MNAAITTDIRTTQAAANLSLLAIEGRLLAHAHTISLRQEAMARDRYNAMMALHPFDPDSGWPVEDSEYEEYAQAEQQAAKDSGWYAALDALYADESRLIDWLRRYILLQPAEQHEEALATIDEGRKLPSIRQILVELALQEIAALSTPA